MSLVLLLLPGQINKLSLVLIKIDPHRDVGIFDERHPSGSLLLGLRLLLARDFLDYFLSRSGIRVDQIRMPNFPFALRERLGLTIGPYQSVGQKGQDGLFRCQLIQESVMKIDSPGAAVDGSPPGVGSAFSDGPLRARVELGSTSSRAPEVLVGS